MSIKSLFNNKFISFLLAIIFIFAVYQLFFRYEYKVFKANKPIFSYTVKLDRLTGKSTIIPNENYKKYLKKKESEEKQIEIKTKKKYGYLNLDDYLKK